ncbi:nitroreductase family protein [Bergeyella sp. RCAD1439]|uniref:nitroreductase family protein n=1 Tax=Bergeyella anatis TaxID=3113737 RepID=UPI002E1951C7|nr:nitroreductase family protein [Bergeyella sp. RCAD1439]
MNLELAQTRYTTKKYTPGQIIEEEKILQLKEILRLSPSSINSQPWHFTFVSDEKIKSELASFSFFNEQKIKDASHLVVFSVVDDLEKFEAQILKNLPEGAVFYYTNFIKPRPEAEIKNWLTHQVYLSLGFFLSACAGLQIDSTAMEGIQTAEYDRIKHRRLQNPICRSLRLPKLRRCQPPFRKPQIPTKNGRNRYLYLKTKKRSFVKTPLFYPAFRFFPSHQNSTITPK